jgi:hypothetical protein
MGIKKQTSAQPSPRASIDRLYRAMELAGSSLSQALEEARRVGLPWYRARALAGVAEHHPQFALGLAREIAATAAAGLDTFQRCSAICWEIFVLMNGGHRVEAEAALEKAMDASKKIELTSCRAEALVYVAQAAALLGEDALKRVCNEIFSVCEGCTYWRCTRVARWARRVLDLNFGL